jgi:hypothetical protein
MKGKEDVSEAAQALSELGAAKGGKARAAKLSPDERREIARHAAQSRWKDHGGGEPKLPKATHSGVLKIGESEIPCYVLENGERILSTRGIMKSLGRTWRGRKYAGTKYPVFIEAQNLKPFISSDLGMVLVPKLFKTDKGMVSEGFSAEILPIVCEIYLDAKDKNALTAVQKPIARKCEILVRGLSRVGIVALVDEATGYQADRARDELNKILEAYISRELLPWTKRFPDEFFKQLYRLRGWDYREGNHRRYRVVGKLVNKLVYEPLPPGVLSELKHKNPPNEKGYRQFKHHQFLTPDIGNEHLGKQLVEITTLMRVSETQHDFERLFRKAFPKRNQQMLMEYQTTSSQE